MTIKKAPFIQIHVMNTIKNNSVLNINSCL